MSEPIKEAICPDCGCLFLTKYGKYCTRCGNKRRGSAHQGKQIRKIEEENDQKESGSRLVAYALKISKAQKEQIKKDCPNRNLNEIKCVICPAGAWEFKDCGR